MKTSLVATGLAAIAVLRTEHAVVAEKTFVLLSLHDASFEEALQTTPTVSEDINMPFNAKKITSKSIIFYSFLHDLGFTFS